MPPFLYQQSVSISSPHFVLPVIQIQKSHPSHVWKTKSLMLPASINVSGAQAVKILPTPPLIFTLPPPPKYPNHQTHLEQKHLLQRDCKSFFSVEERVTQRVRCYIRRERAKTGAREWFFFFFFGDVYWVEGSEGEGCGFNTWRTGLSVNLKV